MTFSPIDTGPILLLTPQKLHRIAFILSFDHSHLTTNPTVCLRRVLATGNHPQWNGARESEREPGTITITGSAHCSTFWRVVHSFLKHIFTCSRREERVWGSGEMGESEIPAVNFHYWIFRLFAQNVSGRMRPHFDRRCSDTNTVMPPKEGSRL